MNNRVRKVDRFLSLPADRGPVEKEIVSDKFGLAYKFIQRLNLPCNTSRMRPRVKRPDREFG